MMLLLLISVSIYFSAGYAAGSRTPDYALPRCQDLKSYLESGKPLGPYQDAWKFLETGDQMYLYQRSFELDPKYGNNAKCVRSKHLGNPDDKQRTVPVDLSFVYDNLTEVHFTVYFTANKTSKGETSNVTYASYNLGELGYPFPVVFADYKSCAVVRVPHRDNGTNQACELWVYKDRIKDFDSCCLFIFDLFCGSNTHKIYDKNRCEGYQTC